MFLPPPVLKCGHLGSQIAKSNLNVVRNDMKENAMAAMAQVKHEAMKRLMDMRSGDTE